MSVWGKHSVRSSVCWAQTNCIQQNDLIWYNKHFLGTQQLWQNQRPMSIINKCTGDLGIFRTEMCKHITSNRYTVLCMRTLPRSFTKIRQQLLSNPDPTKYSLVISKNPFCMSRWRVQCFRLHWMTVKVLVPLKPPLSAGSHHFLSAKRRDAWNPAHRQNRKHRRNHNHASQIELAGVD